MGKTLQTILEQANLNENEVAVYQFLLEHGRKTATNVAEATNLKRGNTYYVLDNLIEKQLVEKTKEGKKTLFRTTHPQFLQQLIQGQKTKLEEAQNTLSAHMDTLKSKYNMVNEKPGVYFFEGKEGLRTVFEDIYANDKKEVIGAVELEKLEEAFPDMLQKNLIPKRVKGKLRSIAFIVDTPKARELVKNDERDNRESILVDGEKYPMPAEVDVYKDRVAMLSFDKGTFIGVVIENEDIATTLDSIMRLARDHASAN